MSHWSFQRNQCTSLGDHHWFSGRNHYTIVVQSYNYRTIIVQPYNRRLYDDCCTIVAQLYNDSYQKISDDRLMKCIDSSGMISDSFRRLGFVTFFSPCRSLIKGTLWQLWIIYETKKMFTFQNLSIIFSNQWSVATM